MVTLRRLIHISVFLFLGCQTNSITPIEEKAFPLSGDAEIDSQISQFNNEYTKNLGFSTYDNKYFLRITFRCQPEMNESYRRRVETIVSEKIYLKFFEKNDQFIDRGSMKFNSLVIAFDQVSKKIFDKTDRIEFNVKNRTVNATREELKKPILLPDSVCG